MQENNYNNGMYGGYYPPNVPNLQEYRYIPRGIHPEFYEKKKKIKRVALLVSLSLVFLWLISKFWIYGYLFGMQFIGFSYNSVVGFLNDPAIGKVISIILSILIFTLPFVIVFKAGKYRISNLVPLNKPDKKLILPLFLCGIAFCSISNIISGYFQSIFDIFGIGYNVNYEQNPDGFFGFMLSLISVVLVPALVEEFACRGIILGSLRKFGDSFSIICSAILFGLMHGNFEQMPFAFLVGLILGFITVKSGSMWIAVAVHAFNNLSSVVLSYILPLMPVQLQNLLYIVLMTVYMISGFIGIVLLRNKKSDFFNFKKQDSNIKESNKYKWFFTSPFIIVFTVLCILDSLKYFVF